MRITSRQKTKCAKLEYMNAYMNVYIESVKGQKCVFLKNILSLNFSQN